MVPDSIRYIILHSLLSLCYNVKSADTRLKDVESCKVDHISPAKVFRILRIPELFIIIIKCDTKILYDKNPSIKFTGNNFKLAIAWVIAVFGIPLTTNICSNNWAAGRSVYPDIIGENKFIFKEEGFSAKIRNTDFSGCQQLFFLSSCFR